MKTIKDFDSFVQKIWDVYSLNFLNSITPNPFTLLDEVDDIVTEYLDDGYEFSSYLVIRQNYTNRFNFKVTDGSGFVGDGWEILCSDLTSKDDKRKRMLINRLIKFDEFKSLINSGNYRLFYRFVFYPKNKSQELGKFLNEFYKPVIGRVGNAFKIDEIYIRLVSGSDSWVFDSIEELESSDPRLPSLNRDDIKYITVHLEVKQ